MLIKGRIALSFGLRGARGKPKKSEQTEFDKIQVFYEYLFLIILCVTCQVLGPAAEWTLKQTAQFGNWVDSRNQLTEVERLNFERKRILIGIIHTI